MITATIFNRNGTERLLKVMPPTLNQSHNDVELVVFDNGSSDGSTEYLKGLKRVKIFKVVRILAMVLQKNNHSTFYRSTQYVKNI